MRPADDEVVERFRRRRAAFRTVIEQAGVAGRLTCPCCGFPTLTERSGFEICGVCGWEDDGQDDGDADVVRGGPNGEASLTAGRIEAGLSLLAVASTTTGDSGRVEATRTLLDEAMDALALLAGVATAKRRDALLEALRAAARIV